jgi:hypothetical protein
MLATAAFEGNVMLLLPQDEIASSFDDSPASWPKSSEGETQATKVTYCENHSGWLSSALCALGRLGKLANNWDSYGAEAPSRLAIETGKYIISVLSGLDLTPTSIDPSAEGGICISFRKGQRYSDIECFNDGTVLAVTAESDSKPNVWRLAGDADVAPSIKRMKAFLDY